MGPHGWETFLLDDDRALKAVNEPTMLPFYVLELEDNRIQIWYDTSKCCAISLKDSEDELKAVLNELKVRYGFTNSNFVLIPGSVYRNSNGNIKLAYLPVDDAGEEDANDDIVIKASDLKHFG